jgi:hypothetical protein
LIAPAPGRDVKRSKVQIVENSPDVAIAEATFLSAEGKPLGLRYELQIGQTFVKTEALAGTKAARIDVPCRYVVLPDFFADDIVADARQIPVPRAELPSENFLLHLVDGGDALVMSVSNARDEDARMTLSGEADARRFESSEIPFGTDGKLWVAVIEGPRAWHERNVAKADAGKIVPLEWKAPFPAQWRVDWRRFDGLTSSWEMIAELPGGDFTKHGWFGSPTSIPKNRQRWTTVLGSFAYPCWLDREGRGHLQPLARVHKFEGPALVYPINRVKETPLDRFTVVDLVRATLGVGPCEYILDVEGQGQAYKGRATCATRDALKEIYASGKQKEKRAEILRILDDVMVFVKHIRGRIEDYVVFGHETLDYLQQEKRAHPELADFLGEMEGFTRGIDAAVAKRRERIKTPDYVAALTQKFRDTLLDAEGPEAQKRCREITEAIVEVGGNQDELVGECRLAVKILRQRAALALATNPPAAEVARQIRARTQKILRNATSYEAPRQ